MIIPVEIGTQRDFPIILHTSSILPSFLLEMYTWFLETTVNSHYRMHMGRIS